MPMAVDGQVGQDQAQAINGDSTAQQQNNANLSSLMPIAGASDVTNFAVQ